MSAGLMPQQFCVVHDLGSYDKNTDSAERLCHSMNTLDAIVNASSIQWAKHQLSLRVPDETIERYCLRVTRMP